MEKTFIADREDRPGAAWLARFQAGRAEADRWYRGVGMQEPPTASECRAAMRRHMPELVPAYDDVCDLVGDDDLAHRILSHYRPASIPHGCQAGDMVGREVRYCQLPDGRIVPYIDLGDGYAAIPADAAGHSAQGTGFAAGRLLTEQGMPTFDKPGGIAGGGASGPVTSPASRALRELTGQARLQLLRSFGSPAASVGGSIARMFPYLGVLESFLGFLRSSAAYESAPVCKPIA